jgi:hypothetical protein
MLLYCELREFLILISCCALLQPDVALRLFNTARSYTIATWNSANWKLALEFCENYNEPGITTDANSPE